ncbi:MRG/MORF4L-binding protein [Lepeophtheirus salmonis]|uniref:MRG/MORF4L-binding protein n=1 Tax=Lepeophtheirus salmonis TaxID=72036 RepID=UPI001AE68D44|nr:MRG/MORF4L-binding protein-like [Lepeophtheirus salmonis]
MTTGGGSRSSGSIKSSTEWSPELEMKFYASLCTHRPSGVSKHFMMALVLNDLKGNLDGETLWKKLEDLYDLRALEKVAVKDEDPFFHADGKASEFSLPKRDFGVMLNEKKKEMAIVSTTSSSNSITTITDVTEKKTETPPTQIVPTNNETPKSSSGSSKRPTRSTPSSSSSNKRRK